MGFVRADEKTEWSFACRAFADELVDRSHVRVLLSRVFERECLLRPDVGFAAECDPVAERLEIMDHAFHVILDEGVIRIGSAFDRIESGVDVVPRGRAHRCGLEAAGHANPLPGELVDVRRAGLAAITSDVAKGEIVRDDEHQIRFRSVRALDRKTG